MSYLKPLITLNFWFGLSPVPFLKPVFIALGIALIVGLIMGIVIKWMGVNARQNPPLHRVYSRVGRAVLTVAAIGWLLYFFSYEQIMFVSARFWWGLLAIGAVVWTVFIVRDVLKNYPIEKKLLADRLAREKYLPKQ